MKNAFMTLLLAGAVAAPAARGDAGDSWFFFETVGPDAYADGSPVVAGESYALVWTPNAAFGGLDADGKPTVAGDRLIVAAPVAAMGENGMHCPLTLFQVKRTTAEALGADGHYAVVLLDTRVDGGTAVREAGLPRLVNGWGQATEAADSLAARDTLGTGAEDSTTASRLAGVPAGVKQPKVKAIDVGADSVVLTVENLGGYVRAQSGTRPDGFAATGAAQSAPSGGGDVRLVVPKPGDESGFFRVVGN